MLKRLGVIGGMGSEATSYYFEQLVSHTKVERDQDHIDTIIFNNTSLPDRTESILKSDTNVLLEKLIKNARILENLGVENIAIPCNTAHYFYESINKEISIPIIHMVRETILYTSRKYENLKKVGIMATQGTIDTRVYHKECKKLGLEAVAPSQERQNDITSLIYEDIKKGKPGDFLKFQRTYEELMEAECDVIILACTELSLFKKENKINDNCIDAMDVLVKESIIRSGSKYQ